MLTVPSSLLCLSAWGKRTVGKTKSRACFALGHSTAQIRAQILRCQLMKGKRLEKGWSYLKHCSGCLLNPGKTLSNMHLWASHERVYVVLLPPLSYVLDALRGWQALGHPLPITESEFTQGSVSYGHLGKRSASTCKRRNSLKSEKNLHVPVGILRGVALLTPPWKRRLWHEGARTSEEW